MQSPPARADATSVHSLSPTFARPCAVPRSRDSSTSSLTPSCWARVAGRSRPASATSCAPSNATSSRSRLWEDRIQQVLLCLGRWVYRNAIIPDQLGTCSAVPDRELTRRSEEHTSELHSRQ